VALIRLEMATLRDTFYQHHVLAVDGGLAHVADFYGVELEAIFQASIRAAPWQGRPFASKEAFAAAVQGWDLKAPARVEENVFIPPPRGELEWEMLVLRTTGGGHTLDQICHVHRHRRERRAAHMPALTPHFLWHLFANHWLRELTFTHNKDVDPAEIDRHPGRYELPSGVRIRVPYPKPVTAAVIVAPPRPQPGAGEPDVATRGVTPDWVQALTTRWIVPLDRKCHVLELDNKKALGLAQDGARLVHRVGSLRQVLARSARESGRPATRIDDDLLEVQKKAAELLLHAPWSYITAGADTTHETHARDVLEAMADSDFAESVMRAFGSEHVVNGEALREKITSVLLRSIAAVAESPLCTNLTRVVDATLDADYPEPPSTSDAPLSIVMKSVIQQASQVAGNLPGPASLMSAMVEVSNAVHFPEIVISLEANKAVRQIERVRPWVARLCGLTEDKVAEIEKAVAAARTPAGARHAAEPLHELLANPMTSRAWGGAMTGLNLLLLYWSIGDAAGHQSSDAPAVEMMRRYREIGNVIGGGTNTVVAFAQAADKLRPGQVLGDIAEDLGTFTAVIGLVSGMLTAFEGYVTEDGSLMRSGLFSLTGGATTLIAAAFAVPELAIAGIAISLLGSAWDLAEATAPAMENPMARFVRVGLESLRLAVAETEVGKAGMRKLADRQGAPELGDPWAELQSAIAACLRSVGIAGDDLARLERTPENLAFVRRLVRGSDRAVPAGSFLERMEESVRVLQLIDLIVEPEESDSGGGDQPMMQ
jgi:hypothetical protein